MSQTIAETRVPATRTLFHQDQSEKIEKLADALSKAQKQLSAVEKDGKNSHFGNNYSTLGAVLEACHKVLPEHGLSISHTCKDKILRTRLMHTSGQWIAGEMPLLMSRQDMQGFGSALTYARRYATTSIVGLPEKDDDGNVAAGNHLSSKTQYNPNGGFQHPKREPYKPHTGEPAEFVVPYGKNKGLKIKELDPGIVQGDIEYWENRAHQDRKPLSGRVADYVDNLKKYTTQQQPAQAPQSDFIAEPQLQEDDIPF